MINLQVYLAKKKYFFSKSPGYATISLPEFEQLKMSKLLDIIIMKNVSKFLFHNFFKEKNKNIRVLFYS